jgi:hypothetical protein
MYHEMLVGLVVGVLDLVYIVGCKFEFHLLQFFNFILRDQFHDKYSYY